MFLDRKRAFETIDGTLLVEKLKSYDTEKVVPLWLEDYLRNKYRISTNDFRLIDIAVSQNSILGPLLLEICINYNASNET